MDPARGMIPISMQFPLQSQPTTAPLHGALGALGWVDLTALSILSVFLVLGFFRGCFWQLSRVATILLGIHLAGKYAGRLEPRLIDWLGFSKEAVAASMPFYAAYFLIFLGVLIALSIVATLLEKLVKKAGLTFYDRLFGGALGIGTGGVLVFALLILVFCVFPANGTVVRAAEASKSLAFSKKALDAAHGLVPPRWIPDGVRAYFGLPSDAELLQRHIEAQSRPDSRPDSR